MKTIDHCLNVQVLLTLVTIDALNTDQIFERIVKAYSDAAKDRQNGQAARLAYWLMGQFVFRYRVERALRMCETRGQVSAIPAPVALKHRLRGASPLKRWSITSRGEAEVRRINLLYTEFESFAR